MILIVYPKKILIKILENKLAYLQKKKKRNSLVIMTSYYVIGHTKLHIRIYICS